MTGTRIVIVDDHTLVRESLVRLVSAEEDLDVVAAVGDGDEAISAIRIHRPDVVLLDITLPGRDGFEVARTLLAQPEPPRICFLTMHDEDAVLRAAVALGVDGYVPKSAASAEVVTAIRSVAAGNTYISSSLAARLMDILSGRRKTMPDLTDREIEILRLLAMGSRPGDVAEQLHVSVKTVKNHLTSVYAKLGVETGAQAVAEAYRRRIVEIPAG